MVAETLDSRSVEVSASDDDVMQFADEHAADLDTRVDGRLNPWLVLIADDDDEVHHATAFALRNVLIDDRPLQLLHARSAREAREMLAVHPGVAVAMLDVVMETPDAGLRLVEVIRIDLDLRTLRIVLRTGQPGYAPELEVIKTYDINDYRTKSELTQTRLVTTLTSAIRAFHQLELIHAANQGMDAVSRASNALLRVHAIDRLAQGVFQRMSEIVGCPLAGFLCVEHASSGNQDDAGLRLIHGTGRYASHLGALVATSLDADMQRSIRRCIAAQTHVFESDRFLLWFGAPKIDVVAVFVHEEPLQPLIKRLVEMFAVSLGVGFENADLIERLDFFAYSDPLTHLSNRTRFLEEVTEALFGQHARARAMGLIDIVRFSEVNDALGFRCGDSLLMLVAKRLKTTLPPGIHLARLSGDTFGIFGWLDEINPESLHHAFAAPFFVHGHSIAVQIRIGMVRVSDTRSNPLELLRDANLALNEARRSTGASTTLFSAALAEAAQFRISMLHSLRAAIDFQRGMSLHFQPVFGAGSGKLLGVEALLRWRNESGQMISPADFIPLAERTGMIGELGLWVVESAMARFAVWQRLGYKDFFLSINLSSVQFRDEHLVDRIRRALEDNDLAPQALVVELTESICGEDRQRVQTHLEHLRTMGVRVAIDDFGSGQFSLQQLLALPIDIVKIDPCFSAEPDAPEKNRSLLQAITLLARGRGMVTVAEGVETDAQRQALAEAGCDALQGFLLCRPLSAEQFDGWLRSHTAPA